MGAPPPSPRRERSAWPALASPAQPPERVAEGVAQYHQGAEGDDRDAERLAARGGEPGAAEHARAHDEAREDAAAEAVERAREARIGRAQREAAEAQVFEDLA